MANKGTLLHHGSSDCELWHYRLWSFQGRGTKLERFLHKNQHAQRKLLNFENWTNGEPQYLAKIRVFKIDYFNSPIIFGAKIEISGTK
jgi:hypothetical protein